jgi:hypothetical protein
VPYRTSKVPRRPCLTAALLTAALLGGWATSSGCVTAPSPTDTGLTGIVTRGPIQPACQPGIPCDAPFAAGFTVRRHSRPIAAFRSDANGHFEVRLSPGAYLIVPDADAPVIAPATQVKEAVVLTGDLTEIHLHFDTGIR